ncbi:MAG TPA: polysaccharide deacetylase family protein [Puia sp.]|nr:polysaccharide deacetylase family protein [Puia sp.]
MFYFVKTPWLLKKFYSGCIWSINTDKKIVYLTFDDGPHREATPFILNELKKYKAKATFFCIGKNVMAEPGIYRTILDNGHRVGNHTHHHLNGWKTKDEEYFKDIELASKHIDSNLFRPPYGRMSHFQLAHLRSSFNYKVIMWDVLSADFDQSLTGEKCAKNVTAHTKAGSIVIFHDSTKAFERLEIALPIVLNQFSEKGYVFESIF